MAAGVRNGLDNIHRTPLGIGRGSPTWNGIGRCRGAGRKRQHGDYGPQNASGFAKSHAPGLTRAVDQFQVAVGTDAGWAVSIGRAGDVVMDPDLDATVAEGDLEPDGRVGLPNAEPDELTGDTCGCISHRRGDARVAAGSAQLATGELGSDRAASQSNPDSRLADGRGGHRPSRGGLAATPTAGRVVRARRRRCRLRCWAAGGRCSMGASWRRSPGDVRLRATALQTRTSRLVVVRTG